MAFTTPGTAVAGEVYTAAFYNEQTRDNLNAIRDAQVNIQSTFKEDTFTSTGQSFFDITGLSVTITPSSASSKVLILASISASSNIATANYLPFQLVRGSTAISVPTSSPGSFPGSTGVAPQVNLDILSMPIVFLDSPGVATSVTYKIQGRNTSVTADLRVNLRGDGQTRTTSSITAIEVPV